MEATKYLTTIFNYWPTFLTIGMFIVALKIQAKLKSLIFNAFIMTTIFLICFLLIFKLDYSVYKAGNEPLALLLKVSVVALAVPLYQQIHVIRQSWSVILSVSFVASIVGMLSSVLLCILFGVEKKITLSLLPKSITAPIAMVISENLHGLVPITIISVVISGLFGLLFGYYIFDKLGITKNEARGLGMGSASHALGTAKCHEINTTDGNYSAIALVLCGVIGSFIAPLISFIVIHVFY